MTNEELHSEEIEIENFVYSQRYEERDYLVNELCQWSLTICDLNSQKKQISEAISDARRKIKNIENRIDELNAIENRDSRKRRELKIKRELQKEA